MAFIPRIFIGSDSINGNSATVGGSDFTHIVKVLRKNVGDSVTVCDMHSNAFSAVIEEIGENELILKLGDAIKEDNELPFKVTVYQCLPKGEKADTVVQKAVELGAGEMVFVASERCVAKPDEKSFLKRLERMNRISESAAAQCGRSFVPNVRGLIGFDEAVDEIASNDNGFVCYEGDETIPLRNLLSKAKAGSIAFLIGPEGGLSKRETEKAFERNLPLANLGKRILRTETAGLYVLSAISVLLE